MERGRRAPTRRVFDSIRRMKKLAPKGLGFLENPPASMDFEATMRCSALELFDILASAEKLGLWLDDFKGVDWLSEPPHGAGSRREVRLAILTVHERFVAWEPGKRISFTMEGMSLPIVEAVGEDMRIEPIDEDHCKLTWRVAYELTWYMRPLDRLVRWNFGKLFRKSLQNLQKLCAR